MELYFCCSGIHGINEEMSNLIVDFQDRTDTFLVYLAAAFLLYHSLLLSAGQLGKGFAQT